MAKNPKAPVEKSSIFEQGKDLLMSLIEAVDERLGGVMGFAGDMARDAGKEPMQSYSVGSGEVPYDQNFSAASRSAGVATAMGQSMTPSAPSMPETPSLTVNQMIEMAGNALPEGIRSMVNESLSQLASWVPRGGAENGPNVLAQASELDLGTYERPLNNVGVPQELIAMSASR